MTIDSPLTNGKSANPDTFHDYLEDVTGIAPETPPQTDSEKLDEILSLLRPLAPALQALPELMENIGPIIEGIKKSPVLKALGVRL